jgi:hypothetical protein
MITTALLLLLSWVVAPSNAFVARPGAAATAGEPCRPLRAVVDPAVLPTAAAAVGGADLTVAMVAAASAAAGALSQLPRIRQLEAELEAARDELRGVQAEMEAKMAELEERLFRMDQEYEEQTARFKRQYDRSQVERVERLRDRMQREYRQKLDIKLEEQRSSRLLSEGLKAVADQTERQAELSQLRLQQQRIRDANAKLEQALLESDRELERLRVEAKKRKLLPWF